jgi:hypothetical protein
MVSSGGYLYLSYHEKVSLMAILVSREFDGPDFSKLGYNKRQA